jgi:hypothetical protein
MLLDYWRLGRILGAWKVVCLNLGMNTHRSLTDFDPGRTHFWISDVLGSMSQASLSDTLARFPWAGKIYMLLRPGWLKSLMAASQRHQSYTMKVTTQ